MFEILKENLTSLGYSVSVFENSGDAAKYIDSKIDKTSVGIGGSLTVREMGLYPMLARHNDVAWHWELRDDMSAHELRAAARDSEVYISSVNGLSQNGEIINIDGACNRVSEIFYGHRKVWLVVGKNKIAPDFESALFRARNIAAPKNAQRLGAKTPCALKGEKCYNCKSEGRICRGLSVLWKKPMLSDIEVVIINEELGY